MMFSFFSLTSSIPSSIFYLYIEKEHPIYRMYLLKNESVIVCPLRQKIIKIRYTILQERYSIYYTLP